MKLKRKNLQDTPLVPILAIVFIVGVVLGAVSFYYINGDIIEEARDAFSLDKLENIKISEILRNNFLTELCWMIAIWFTASIGITTPLSAAVMGIRGFFTGFSVTFFIAWKENTRALLLANIVPQCLMALPVMTVYTLMCINTSINRGKDVNTDTKYFILGIIAVAGAFLIGAVECGLTYIVVEYAL